MPAVADIVKISAPSSASAGATVIVDVSVKNISPLEYWIPVIAVTGVYDSTLLTWQFDYLLVDFGQTIVMRGNFTMPSKKVTVIVWSWYWDGGKWMQDDYGSIDIALPTITPEFAGFNITDYTKA